MPGICSRGIFWGSLILMGRYLIRWAKARLAKWYDRHAGHCLSGEPVEITRKPDVSTGFLSLILLMVEKTQTTTWDVETLYIMRKTTNLHWLARFLNTINSISGMSFINNTQDQVIQCLAFVALLLAGHWKLWKDHNFTIPHQVQQTCMGIYCQRMIYLLAFPKNPDISWSLKTRNVEVQWSLGLIIEINHAWIGMKYTSPSWIRHGMTKNCLLHKFGPKNLQLQRAPVIQGGWQPVVNGVVK